MKKSTKSKFDKIYKLKTRFFFLKIF